MRATSPRSCGPRLRVMRPSGSGNERGAFRGRCPRLLSCALAGHEKATLRRGGADPPRRVCVMRFRASDPLPGGRDLADSRAGSSTTATGQERRGDETAVGRAAAATGTGGGVMKMVEPVEMPLPSHPHAVPRRDIVAPQTSNHDVCATRHLVTGSWLVRIVDRI